MLHVATVNCFWKSVSLKRAWSIFHYDAKYLASGVGVGQCPRRQNFAVEIPTGWYILALTKAKNCVSPDTKLKICVSPDANPRRQLPTPVSGIYVALGLWRWPCIFHVYFMYISCIFHVVCASFSALATRKSADAKAVFSGIWA